jgi:alpha-tubulin suppressor-like RCC1 family protein
MKKNIKVVVEQVVIDDTTYIKEFSWTIIDDSGKVYAKGKEDSLKKALEVGKRRMSRI